ncbi:uncharacterized protein AKAME5_002071100 [Lates japonicus]|uniref:Uncharacterized protein n=1 Tax=Lates japonicus TaxID=270547 RepID=A0AAD3NBP7_LATJO|nr:uncharacterized protein AKAME5_002071100 [Lates japonicus]
MFSVCDEPFIKKQLSQVHIHCHRYLDRYLHTEAKYTLSAVRMNLTCLRSSDPAAANASLLFDFNNDHQNLWVRESLSAPLPQCSSLPPPSPARCLPCLREAVFAVCRDLTRGVEVVMEADGSSVRISESECPALSDDASWWRLAAAIISILTFIFIMVVLCCKFCRGRRRSREV